MFLSFIHFRISAKTFAEIWLPHAGLFSEDSPLKSLSQFRLNILYFVYQSAKSAIKKNNCIQTPSQLCYIIRTFNFLYFFLSKLHLCPVKRHVDYPILFALLMSCIEVLQLCFVLAAGQFSNSGVKRQAFTHKVMTCVLPYIFLWQENVKKLCRNFSLKYLINIFFVKCSNLSFQETRE